MAIFESARKCHQDLGSNSGALVSTHAILGLFDFSGAISNKLFEIQVSFCHDGKPSLEILETLSRLDGKATAYICENYVCQLPTNDVAVVARLLDQ